MAEDAEGPVCQVCGEARVDEARVTCAVCGTLHHLDCWKYVGHCSTFACGAHQYRQGGATLGGVPAPIEDAASNTPAELYIDTRGRALVDGRRVRTSVGRVLDAEGWVVELDEPRVHLDVDTPFELFLQWTAAALTLIGFSVGFPKHGPSNPALFARWAAAALGVAALRMVTKFTYVLDNYHERVLFVRRFLGFTWEYPLVDFDQVDLVGAVGRIKRSKYSSWWEYAVVMRLADGSQIEVSPETRDLARVNGFAASLARHLECDVRRGGASRTNLGDGRNPHLPMVLPTWGGPLAVFGGTRGPWVAFFLALLLVEACTVSGL